MPHGSGAVTIPRRLPMPARAPHLRFALALAILTITLDASAARAQARMQAVPASTIAPRSGYKISAWRNKAIDQHNQSLLVRASMTGAPDGMVLFRTEMGATDKAMRAIASLGGEIMAHFDDVGYFRARIPLKQFARAQAVPGVLMAMIDGAALSYGAVQPNVSYPEPKKSKADSLKADSVARDSTAKDSARVAAMPLIPAAARAAETPFVAMNDMRSYDLRKIDPRFDGRGVTVAVLEFGTFDFLHPALQNAKALDGSTIRKLRGIITPFSYDPDFLQPEEI